MGAFQLRGVSRLGVPVLVCGLLLGLAASASAQLPFELPTFPDDLAIQLNGAHQTGGQEFGERVTFAAYDEQALFEAAHVRDAARSFDMGASLRVWRRLAVGATYTQFTHTDLAVVTGRVPHPFFANQFRLAPADLLRLEHRQRMTHLQILWTQPVWDRIDVTLSAGPTFVDVTQGVLTGLDVSEVAPPYTTIRVDEVSSAEQAVTTVSGHIGVDAAYMFTPQIGAGLFIRYVGGSADIPTLGGDVSVDVGGMQSGGGIRVRF
jgi:hypothetical protein